jgi:acetyl-CoA carboxylase biotin carboxyl carrier protein
MTPGEIERFSRLAQRAGLAELELTEGQSSLRLRLAAEAARPDVEVRADVKAAVNHEAARARDVRSPGVGLFHHRHPVTGRAVCEPGQRVKKGQVVGFVAAGPCVRPATAPEDGVIAAPACEDGELVGYGMLLYTIS